MLEKIYKSKELLNYCKKVAGHYGQDLFQESMVIMLEHPDTDDINIPYAKRLCLYQFVNKYSRFNKTHRQKPLCMHTLKLKLHDHHTSEEMDLLHFASNELNRKPVDEDDWFLQGVFNEICESGSIRKLEAETGINRNTLQRAKHKFITNTKKKLNEHF